MRALPFLFLALWLMSAPAMALQPNGCPDFKEPEVFVKQLVAAPSFNDTLDLASIRKLTIEQGKEIVSTHDVPVGITAASLKLDSRFQVSISINPADRMACAQIAGFDLNVGFEDTVVYLAKELPYRSCSYLAVLEHEMKHVRTDKAFVATYAPYLPDTLRRAIREIGTVRASSSETAEKRLTASIDSVMADIGSDFSHRRQAMQIQIDTPEEYARLGSSCNGELSETIDRAKKLSP